MKGPGLNRISLLAFSFMLIAPLLLTAQNKEEMIIKVEKPGQPGSLKFQNPRGSVNVEGYEGEWVIISAFARIREADGINVPEGMDLIPQQQFELKAETQGNNILLFCESARTVDFNIKVPRSFSLNISSMDNGDIEIIRIDGEIEVDCRAGWVDLINISGSSLVSTVYGNISADVRSLDMGETIMLTSYEGEISLRIEKNLNADFMLQSQTGNIFSDIKIETEEPQIVINEKEKGKEYHLQAWSKGRLNKGGSNIYLSSYEGDIILRERIISY